MYFVGFQIVLILQGVSLVFLFHLTPQGGGGAKHLDSQQVGEGVQNRTTHCGALERKCGVLLQALAMIFSLGVQVVISLCL